MKVKRYLHLGHFLLQKYYTIKKSGKEIFVGTPKHPFYIPNRSVWPFVASWSLFFFAYSLVYYFHGNFMGPCLASTVSYIIVYLILAWTKEVGEEELSGYMTRYVQHNLRVGWSLFILSEVMFFFAFFWAFFHSSLSPAIEIGFVWPPNGINVFYPWEIPLANTVILLSSGAFATWAHYSVKTSRTNLQLGLRCAIVLGVLFTYFQLKEYENAGFSLQDGIYGSLFYLVTGFHGLHVFIGTIFLIICLRKSRRGSLKASRALIDIFIWYWHFVDVVWLFVYSCIYWWGSGFD